MEAISRWRDKVLKILAGRIEDYCLDKEMEKHFKREIDYLLERQIGAV